MADETKDLASSPEEVKEESEEEKDTSMDAEDSPSKDNSKTETKDEENEDDDEEDVEEEKIAPGLLERPVEIEDGRKRERKTVERMSFGSPEGEEKKFEVEKGKGEMLGDMPYVEFKLQRTKAEDTKPLHRVLFRRVGTMHEVKKNIRKFSGFTFSKDDVEYEKRVQMLKAKTFTLPMIKNICEILDVPRSGTKEEICDRLMEWLIKPEGSGKKVPAAKRKRSSTKEKGKKEKKTTEKKNKKTKSKAKSKAVAADSDDDVDNNNEKEEEDEPEDKSDKSDDEKEEEKEQSDSADESDEDFKEPPKKKAKKVTTPKVALKAKKPKSKTKKEVEKTPVAKPKKVSPKKKATPVKKKTKVEDDISDISSDSDDEPLQTKAAPKPKGPPTNDELKDAIKKMLDNANLEEVTMKTILKDVYGRYPSFDLSDRKDFIKNTVKQIIS